MKTILVWSETYIHRDLEDPKLGLPDYYLVGFDPESHFESCVLKNGPPLKAILLTDLGTPVLEFNLSGGIITEIGKKDLEITKTEIDNILNKEK